MIQLFLLGCATSNEPPVFVSFNGEKVRYSFGVAYIDQEEPLKASRGDTIDISLDVTDPNQDSVELFFPQAPPGLEFGKDEVDGFWAIPRDYWVSSGSLQILAVDEMGAADLLSVPFEIGDIRPPERYFIRRFDAFIDFNNEASTLEYRHKEGDCLWAWTEVTIEAIEACSECERSWNITGNGLVSDPTEECQTTYTPDDPIELTVGWSIEATISGVIYPRPVFYFSSEWYPVGQGAYGDQGLRLFIELLMPGTPGD